MKSNYIKLSNLLYFSFTDTWVPNTLPTTMPILLDDVSETKKVQQLLLYVHGGFLCGKVGAYGLPMTGPLISCNYELISDIEKYVF